MSETCETVAVKADNDDGYMIINKADVKPGDVVIGGEAKEPTPPAPPVTGENDAPPPAPPVTGENDAPEGSDVDSESADDLTDHE